MSITYKIIYIPVLGDMEVSKYAATFSPLPFIALTWSTSLSMPRPFLDYMHMKERSITTTEKDNIGSLVSYIQSYYRTTTAPMSEEQK